MITHLVINFLILGLLVCPIAYFIWRWLFAKTFKDQRKHFYATWFFTLVISPLLAWGAAVLLVMFLLYSPERDFDRERWLERKDKRFEMSKNIIESKMLIGKTRAEVKAILGPAESIDNSHHWVYHMGSGGFSIDPYVLSVIFDAEKVSLVKWIES